ncbi:hypothetical protein K502DRAFT_352505 [Neoconidiobolus thromboides FSU 785]|nr:hypothetical protein K502DRAFT_352505 [Neoconidiobolus thromboides FSU 785]
MRLTPLLLKPQVFRHSSKPSNLHFLIEHKIVKKKKKERINQLISTNKTLINYFKNKEYPKLIEYTLNESKSIKSKGKENYLCQQLSVYCLFAFLGYFKKGEWKLAEEMLLKLYPKEKYTAPDKIELDTQLEEIIDIEKYKQIQAIIEHPVLFRLWVNKQGFVKEANYIVSILEKNNRSVEWDKNYLIQKSNYYVKEKEFKLAAKLVVKLYNQFEHLDSELLRMLIVKLRILEFKLAFELTQIAFKEGVKINLNIINNILYRCIRFCSDNEDNINNNNVTIFYKHPLINDNSNPQYKIQLNEIYDFIIKYEFQLSNKLFGYYILRSIQLNGVNKAYEEYEELIQQHKNLTKEDLTIIKGQLIHGLLQQRDLNRVNELLTQININPIIHSKLVNYFIQSKQYHQVVSIYNENYPSHNIISYTLLIKLALINEETELAFQLLEQMKMNNIKYDKTVLNLLVSYSYKKKDIDLIKRVLILFYQDYYYLLNIKSIKLSFSTAISNHDWEFAYQFENQILQNNSITNTNDNSSTPSSKAITTTTTVTPTNNIGINNQLLRFYILTKNENLLPFINQVIDNKLINNNTFNWILLAYLSLNQYSKTWEFYWEYLKQQINVNVNNNIRNNSSITNVTDKNSSHNDHYHLYVYTLNSMLYYSIKLKQWDHIQHLVSYARLIGYLDNEHPNPTTKNLIQGYYTLLNK